jgi:hypothetical protein
MDLLPLNREYQSVLLLPVLLGRTSCSFCRAKAMRQQIKTCAVFGWLLAG